MSLCAFRPAYFKALAAGLLFTVAGCATAPERAPGDAGGPEAASDASRLQDDPGSLLLDDGRDFYEPELDEDTGRRLRVALLVPLSGRGDTVGAALRDAAVMALFEAYDPRLDLRIYDTGGAADGARAAAEKAVADQARLILGPLFARSVEAAGAVAREADVPLVGFSNDRAVAGDGVYLLSFLPEQQVARVAGYAYSQGYRDFGALIPAGDYGDRVLAALGETIQGTRGNLRAVETYPRTVDGVYDPVKRISDYDRRRAAYKQEVAFLEQMEGGMAEELLAEMKGKETLGDLRFDSLLIPEGPPLIRTIATLLPFYEVDTDTVKVMGTMRWDGVDLSNEKSLLGAWYAAPAPKTVDRFRERFDKVFGRSAPRLATLGYDALALVAVMLRESGTSAITREDLEDPSGFQGVDGLFRFRADGTAQRGLAVLQVTDSGAKVVDPPPSSFFALN